MKLISWNVNGLRSVLRGSLFAYLAKEKPDVLCIQETKCQPGDVDATWPKGGSNLRGPRLHDPEERGDIFVQVPDLVRLDPTSRSRPARSGASTSARSSPKLALEAISRLP